MVGKVIFQATLPRVMNEDLNDHAGGGSRTNSMQMLHCSVQCLRAIYF